jgi:hypothetical protein
MPVQGRNRFSSVDVAMAQVIRLAIDDASSADAAATRLRLRVRSDSVLRRVRARLVWELVERATPVGRRAVAILDAALALAASPPVPAEARVQATPRGR